MTRQPPVRETSGPKRLQRFVTTIITIVVLLGSTPASADAGDVLWVRPYTQLDRDLQGGPGSVAVSPDGATVYVTGWTQNATTFEADMVTLAYDASSADLRWTAFYDGPWAGRDGGTDIAVAPQGDRIFVSGYSETALGVYEAVTIGYTASTGDMSWVGHSGGKADGVSDLVMGPNGGKVFVLATSDQAQTMMDFVTLAYAASGTFLWSKTFDGPAHAEDVPASIGVGPGGGKVFVSGSSVGIGTGIDYATIAYETATGGKIWGRRYDGPSNGPDELRSLVASPNGNTVVVTGSSGRPTGPEDAVTIAYVASSGERRWLQRYDSEGHLDDQVRQLAISPDGSSVALTGSSGAGTSLDYETIDYRTADGHVRWTRRYDGPAHEADVATEVAFTPDGTRVVVSGYREGVHAYETCILTIAYRASTGSTRWIQDYRYDNDEAPASLAVGPHSHQIYVTGISYDGEYRRHELTLAYQA
jgi:WD40 repeat protein